MHGTKRQGQSGSRGGGGGSACCGGRKPTVMAPSLAGHNVQSTSLLTGAQAAEPRWSLSHRGHMATSDGGTLRAPTPLSSGRWKGLGWGGGGAN